MVELAVISTASHASSIIEISPDKYTHCLLSQNRGLFILPSSVSPKYNYKLPKYRAFDDTGTVGLASAKPYI